MWVSKWVVGWRRWVSWVRNIITAETVVSHIFTWFLPFIWEYSILATHPKYISVCFGDGWSRGSGREGNQVWQWSEVTAFCMWCGAKTGYYRNHGAKSGWWWMGWNSGWWIFSARLRWWWEFRGKLNFFVSKRRMSDNQEDGLHIILVWKVHSFVISTTNCSSFSFSLNHE